MPATAKTSDAQAIRLINQQISRLESVRGLSFGAPKFRVWFVTTKNLLRRFLSPDSDHFKAFESLDGYTGWSPGFKFPKACETAEELLKAVVSDIEEFGIYRRPMGRMRFAEKNGSFSQIFYGSVEIKNQAIATDNAIQEIVQKENVELNLREIAQLLQQSQDLTRREVKEGLSALEGLGSELRNFPPKRDWKALLDNGEKVLSITERAGDIAKKLAPYTPAIASIIKKAWDLIG